MNIFSPRLFFALGLAFWLGLAPCHGLAGAGEHAAGQTTGLDGQTVNDALGSTPGQLRGRAGSVHSHVFSPREEDLILNEAGGGIKQTSVGLGSAKAVDVAAGQGAADAGPKGAPCVEYESGGDSAAIGYGARDDVSYGLYQIASNCGTMGLFLKFLDAKAPDISRSLATPGPGYASSDLGDMPSAWRRIAAEQGRRFASLQYEFILKSHYEPAAKGISMACGLDVARKPMVLREVLWSTAVQHGVHGATEIFAAAATNLRVQGDTIQNFDRAMIEEIYRLRSGQFEGREAGLQKAALNRLQSEKEKAMDMLKKGRQA
ncbi:MAG: hypothetical protein HQK81_06420 [Desulfovibrionaceae bacterium]|nr:hypothetical protein [Desulfovibrionaceae bacterium]MBF0513684.1 hypothetical protein [Desulfovibrionaceae bacterium]